MEYHLIEDQTMLEDACQQWEQSNIIGVDTEFMRRSTFYPQLALLQLSDGHNGFLIDPLAIKNMSPLKAIFSQSKITKIIHAPSEDLLILK